MSDSINGSIPLIARRAYRLGQISIASVFLSLIAGFAIESVGVNGMLFTFVIPLSLVTILLAYSARRGMESHTSPGYREATQGLRMGLFVLIFAVLFIVAVAIFFSLLLPRG